MHLRPCRGRDLHRRDLAIAFDDVNGDTAAATPPADIKVADNANTAWNLETEQKAEVQSIPQGLAGHLPGPVPGKLGRVSRTGNTCERQPKSCKGGTLRYGIYHDLLSGIAVGGQYALIAIG